VEYDTFYFTFVRLLPKKVRTLLIPPLMTHSVNALILKRRGQRIRRDLDLNWTAENNTETGF